MTKKHKDYLTDMQAEFVKKSTHQYKKGRKEYKTALWEVDVIDHLLEEIVDAWHYAYTLREELKRLRK